MTAKPVLFFFSFLFSLNVMAFKYKVTGNEKTKKMVIHNEIRDLIHKEIDEELIREIRRRIWNLRVFSKVDVNDKNKKIIIKVEERWTLIPIAKATGGGGTSYFAVGSYDINTLGSNTEVGGQYEQLNGRNAGVVWMRKPQFLTDRNLKFGMDLWSINRVRYFYTTDNEENGGFSLERKRLNSFLEYKWDNDRFTVGAQFDYHQDETSEFGLNDDLTELNEENGFDPDNKTVARWYGVYFIVGRLDYENYLVRGKQTKVTSYLVAASEENLEYRSEQQFKYSYFKLFEKNHNFAWQFIYNQNNLDQVQYQKYMGGFGEVRGYMDGNYYNNANWQNNLEHRFDIIEKSYGILQGVVFSDQGKEGEDMHDITESKDEILFSSGVGIRLISPKIYRFVGRFDFAQTHTRYSSSGIAFGIQQFF